MARRGSRPDWLLLAAAGLVALVVFAITVGGAGAASQEDPAPPNVTVYATADGGFENASEIETAFDNGTIYPVADVKVGQTLVVAVDSERLAADLATRNGSTTERFFAALEDRLNFGFVQTNAEPNVALTGLAVDPESTTVYRNRTTTYLSIDTDAVAVGSYPPWAEYEPDPEIPLSGKAYAVAIGYGEPEWDWEAGIHFYAVEAEFHRTNRILAPEEVTGTVRWYVGPEENLVVRATFDNHPTKRAQLDWNRSSVFSEYTLDFSDVPAGTEYTLELVHDGGVVETIEGEVREPEATLRDVEVTAAEGDGDGWVRLTANLSHGGAVIVRDEFGARLGTARLRPGGGSELSIPIRFDDGGAPDTTEIEVTALRQVGSVQRRYPGPNATLTLDVSEYEWETDDWTAPSRPGDPDTGDRSGSSPGRNGSTGDTASAGGSGDGTAGATPTTDGNWSDGAEAVGTAEDGAGPGTGTQEGGYTVGTETLDGDSERSIFGVRTGIVGLVAVLGGTGYLLRRRWPRR